MGPEDPILTVDHFWSWLEETVLPEVYKEEDYLGERKNWKERKFLWDDTSYRVGPIRLRQIRRIPKSCNTENEEAYALGFKFFDRAPCVQVKERGAFEAGSWYNRELNEAEIKEAKDDGDLWTLAYIWQSAGDLRGVPYSGTIKFDYGGGGYSAELGVNLMTGVELVRRLKEAAWIDGLTQVVFLEFTLFNPATQMFQTAMFAYDVPDY